MGSTPINHLLVFGRGVRSVEHPPVTGKVAGSTPVTLAVECLRGIVVLRLLGKQEILGSIPSDGS